MGDSGDPLPLIPTELRDKLPHGALTATPGRMHRYAVCGSLFAPDRWATTILIGREPHTHAGPEEFDEPGRTVVLTGDRTAKLRKGAPGRPTVCCGRSGTRKPW